MNATDENYDQLRIKDEQKEKNRKQGKKNRAAGKAFERKVREYLVKEHWLIVRFDQQVEFIPNPNQNKTVEISPGLQAQTLVHYPAFIGKLVQAKAKYNPFLKRAIMASGGFPDFLCIKPLMDKTTAQFVECKMGKYLTAEEKQKANWLQENLKIPFFIATPGEKRGSIEFRELNFKEEEKI